MTSRDTKLLGHTATLSYKCYRRHWTDSVFSINHLLAIITWGKHREYNQYRWQVQPGRNCAYSWP